ncbi:MAG: 2-oxoacid:acceptor oxidoreductase family protein [Candidatus Berkelbacteria bacterium]|nr:2-oxoacid:acceptor oxidoreductase family protein [Candidatus Berkelbacteria bacterium]
MKEDNLKILLAGEGGQGVQVIAEILNNTAYKAGLESIYIPNYGVEQRGGVSLAYLQLSKNPIAYPKFKIADILVVLCERAINRVKNYSNRKTKIINGIGFVEKVEEHNLSPRTYNMMILGLLTEFLPLDNGLVLKTMEEKFKKKNIPAELLNQNKQAFLLGRGLAVRLPRYAKKLASVPIKDHRKWPTFVKTSSDKPKITIKINPQYCKSCGICIYKCPTNALHFSEKITGIYGAPITEVDIKKCIGCGMCESVCPDTAIEVEKEKS